MRDTTGRGRDAVAAAVKHTINKHKQTEQYRIAIDANTYDRQRNSTILRYSKWLYSGTKAGAPGSDHRLTSNFFRHLNTQRVSYSLGNGVTFAGGDQVKEKLGARFDTTLKTAAYNALIHGVSFLFWSVDQVHNFTLPEFAPLWDEETGALRAGVRYWQVSDDKPVIAYLYEEDGLTKLRAPKAAGGFEIVEEKRPYKLITVQAPADDAPEVVGVENYSGLPIIPIYGSRLKQSTLVGLKSKIDAYDLISSGFANDTADCSEIYWLVTNAGGMDDDDLARFRERLRVNHIANVKDADDVSVTPYTQEIPTAARTAFLEQIRASIYEDFGALDVHTIAAGATNDHIAAGYQPMDDAADDFEFEVINAVQNLLALIGLDDTPIFKRNQISNEKERTEMIISAANWLDDETVLTLLPFLSPDQVRGVIERKAADDVARWQDDGAEVE